MLVAILALFGFAASVEDPSSRISADGLKKKCFGYTIIEAGKGVDCNGDTIRLEKNFGYFELAGSRRQAVGNHQALAR